MKRSRRDAGAVSKLRKTASARPARSSRVRGKSAPPIVTAAGEVESLRAELKRATSRAAVARWNANPDDVQRSVMQLVLTLVEFIRRVLERQAIRRLEARTLTKKETEDVGLALMRLEETIHDLGAQFGLRPEELNLDLGPLGKLM